MDTMYRKYAPLWNKYRPAILKMMLDAAQEPQQYKLTEHEFRAMDDRKNKGFGFNLVVSESKALNNIKDSEAAQDLLNMLQLSRKGSELLQLNSYEMTLDKHFLLRIQQVKSETETKETETK